MAKEKTLIKRGTLKINLDVVTLAPNFNGNIDKVICNETDFNKFLKVIMVIIASIIKML